MKAVVHSTAIIHPGAELEAGVEVGPYCIVSSGSKIGARTKLMSHVVFDGLVQVGEDNVFHPFCVIGGSPQDLGYKGEPTRVLIGSRNHFRESVTVHRGTAKDRTITTIGDDNYIMAYCHVAHDCTVGNHLIMANQVALAGHVTIGDFVTIGGVVGIVQHVRVGDYSFIAAGGVMRKDLPPYMAAKDHSEVSGPNLVGLKRRGVPDEDIRVIRDIYRTLYLSNLTTAQALQDITEKFPANDYARRFIDFARGSKIGLQR
jgi:UDP-N-acetylglucosamine acyltransferase